MIWRAGGGIAFAIRQQPARRKRRYESAFVNTEGLGKAHVGIEAILHAGVEHSWALAPRLRPLRQRQSRFSLLAALRVGA